MQSIFYTRAVSLIAAAAVFGASAPPPAKIVPFSQTFYGTVRNDPYHWMEDGGPDLSDYLDRQSAYTQAILSANPGRPRALKALQRADSEAAKTSTTLGVLRIGSRLFYMQTLPGSDNPSVLVRDDAQATSKVIVNAASLPKDRVISWFEPSQRATKIAYGVTASSEAVTVHVCDVDGTHDTLQAIAPAVIPDASWRGERAFYYSTVVESAHDRTETSYLHTVGSRLGTDVPIAGFGVDGPMGSKTSRDIFTQYVVLGSDEILAMPQHDVTPHKPVYAAPFSNSSRANAPWRRIFGEDDRVVQVSIAGDNVYALSDVGSASRTILVRDRRSGKHVRTIAPHGDGLRTDIFANETGVYVVKRVGAEMIVERYGLDGNFIGNVALPKANTILQMQANPAEDSFAIETATYNDPGRWFLIGGPSAAVRDAGITPPPPATYAHYHSIDSEATSADGTKVPYTVIYTDATPKDGNRPTLVLAYGAYGYVIAPPIPNFAAAGLDLGIVTVLVHARGGGEYGEPWHLGGKGPTKQHTIDDFVAASEAVVADGWTSHAKLAGIGGSAGGIAIGGAIVQHPELFAVAISQVGFNDMVDYENMPNGPGNVPEFGSVKTPNGFRDLLAMSAYDHVVPAAYPATILTTGRNDRRDAPWQVAKMTARLQASTTSGKPILLRADAQGHGVIRDVTDQDNEYADVYTFVLWQMGEAGFTTP